MYGYNYPMNSLTGLFDWKNIKDLRAGVEFAPFKKLKIKLNGREFWLANTKDGLYNSYGTPHRLQPQSHQRAYRRERRDDGHRNARPNTPRSVSASARCSPASI